jgi:hypothetical protein
MASGGPNLSGTRQVPTGSTHAQEPADAARSLASIVAAVGNGDLTPSEASELTKLVEGSARVLETVDHEERLKALEGRIKDGNRT